jgi:DNA repair exonuclease SbcCD ATPase subunit
MTGFHASKFETGVFIAIGFLASTFFLNAAFSADTASCPNTAFNSAVTFCQSSVTSLNSTLSACRAKQDCEGISAFSKCQDRISETNDWPADDAEGLSEFLNDIAKECPEIAAKRYDLKSENMKDMKDRIDELFEKSSSAKVEAKDAEEAMYDKINDATRAQNTAIKETEDAINDLYEGLRRSKVEGQSELRDLRRQLNQLKTERRKAADALVTARNNYKSKVRTVMIRCEADARQKAEELGRALNERANAGKLNYSNGFVGGLGQTSGGITKYLKRQAKKDRSICKNRAESNGEIAEALAAYNSTVDQLRTQDEALAAEIQEIIAALAEKADDVKVQQQLLVRRQISNAQTAAKMADLAQQEAKKAQEIGMAKIQLLNQKAQALDQQRSTQEQLSAALAVEIKGLEGAAGFEDFFSKGESGVSPADYNTASSAVASACCQKVNSETLTNGSCTQNPEWPIGPKPHATVTCNVNGAPTITKAKDAAKGDK